MKDFIGEPIYIQKSPNPLTTGLNQIKIECYEIAKSKGWHEEKRELPELLCLIHSEISEALEEYRNNKPLFYIENGKPEGILTELADAVIRIFDTIEAINPYTDFEAIIRKKMEYNKTRENRHGGKVC